MSVFEIEKDFGKQVLQSSDPVAVEFWAPWCGYCRRLAPAVERVAEEHTLRVGKVNIDQQPKLAEQYGVDTIPTLILFRDGKPVDSVVNPPSQDAIESWLREHGAL